MPKPAPPPPGSRAWVPRSAGFPALFVYMPPATEYFVHGPPAQRMEFGPSAA
jgi:hypothetical protein